MLNKQAGNWAEQGALRKGYKITDNHVYAREKMAETSSSASESLSNSSVSLSCESSSDATSSSVVNVLECLKAPRLSELGRKRTVRANLPPIGKQTCRGHRAPSSEPKGVSPAQRIKENPNEALMISNRLLFCSACRKELSLKSSSIGLFH